MLNDKTKLLGTWQDRVPVAIKQLRNDRIDNAGGYEKAKDEFFKEARIFKLMNHPNLVQVIIKLNQFYIALLHLYFVILLHMQQIITDNVLIRYMLSA